MKVVFYTKHKNTVIRQKFHEEVEKRVPAAARKNIREIEELKEMLYGSVPQEDIIVLLAENISELEELAENKKTLVNFKTVLVLPDRSDSTIALGHSLCPRFISDIEGDFFEITAVLNKMAGGF